MTTVRSCTCTFIANAIRRRLFSGESLTSIAPRACGPTAILCMYATGGGTATPPGSVDAATLNAWLSPPATSDTPSTGSSARSTRSRPAPIRRPATSRLFEPSAPITIRPSNGMPVMASSITRLARVTGAGLVSSPQPSSRRRALPPRSRAAAPGPDAGRVRCERPTGPTERWCSSAAIIACGQCGAGVPRSRVPTSTAVVIAPLLGTGCGAPRRSPGCTPAREAAATMKSRNSGCGRPGRERNSG